MAAEEREKPHDIAQLESALLRQEHGSGLNLVSTALKEALVLWSLLLCSSTSLSLPGKGKEEEPGDGAPTQ